MGERQFGPYRLVRQIAVGGMAEIHLAKARGIAGFEKYVALKMIHPNFSQDEQFIQMLIDEAKITVQLQHVNIAQTFDLGRVSDTYYITMEYVDGADLYKLLRRGSERDADMPVDVAAYVAKEMANGLDYAHRKRDVTGAPLGIVHRDVSPQNVLISHAGEVKLVDFGIAKATMRARQTAVGVIKGKYYYMSPEQAWGDPVDHRSDIFSCGIVLYEMLTGQMLYLEEDLHRLLDMVRKANIAPPTTLRRDIPPQLERIVMNALHKRAQDRYQTAADLATDLERFLHVYSPVFTGGKVAEYYGSILGEEVPPPPVAPPAEQPAVVDHGRDPNLSTQPISPDQLLQDRSELADENSVIFRVSDLKRPTPGDEHDDEGGTTAPQLPRRSADANTLEAMDLEGVEERTVVSGPPGFGGHDPAAVQAADAPTMTGSDDAAIAAALAEESLSGDYEPTVIERNAGPGQNDQPDDDEDGPTMTHTPGRQLVSTRKPPARPPPEPPRQHQLRPASGPPAHPALSARTAQPALSQVRKPRPSRRTPPDGVPATPGGGSVLRAIVNSGFTEPMPTRPVRGTGPSSDGVPHEVAPQESNAPAKQIPEHPAHHRIPQPVHPGMIAGENGAPQLPLAAPMQTPHPFKPLPSGVPPATLTKQLQAIELEEIPEALKLRNPSRWILRGALALVVVAAGVVIGFFALGAGGEPPSAELLIQSKPSGATVLVDGNEQPEKTPLLFKGATAGGKHSIVIRHGPGYDVWRDEVLVPERGGQIQVFAFLSKTTVRLVIGSVPAGADVYIGDEKVGTTPLTLDELDPATATSFVLRKDGFEDQVRQLDWSQKSEQEFEVRMTK